jgi:hypothetical protein
MDYSKYTIKRTVIDEGDAMCLMSLTFWKAIGSPTLYQSLTMLTAFDGHSFHPRSILPTFPVYLGGNTVEVDIDVVDAPLDYKLLLGHNWTYSMTAVASSFFCTLCFPHDGKIMTIDQLSFVHTRPNASVEPLIPVNDNSQPENEDIGVRMYSSLMGTFDFVAPIHHIYVMSSRSTSSMRFIPFCTLYFNDPWTQPSSTSSCEG